MINRNVIAIRGKRYSISLPRGKGPLSKNNIRYLAEYINVNHDLSVEQIAQWAFVDVTITLHLCN